MGLEPAKEVNVHMRGCRSPGICSHTTAAQYICSEPAAPVCTVPQPSIDVRAIIGDSPYTVCCRIVSPKSRVSFNSVCCKKPTSFISTSQHTNFFLLQSFRGLLQTKINGWVNLQHGIARTFQRHFHLLQFWPWYCTCGTHVLLRYKLYCTFLLPYAVLLSFLFRGKYSPILKFLVRFKKLLVG